jgi:hypothetical protein
MNDEERVERYRRIKEMRHRTPPMTLADIGASFDPPLSKERVRQILATPPRRPGRHKSDPKREDIVARLAFWETRRARLARRGEDTTFADTRVAALTAELEPYLPQPGDSLMTQGGATLAEN